MTHFNKNGDHTAATVDPLTPQTVRPSKEADESVYHDTDASIFDHSVRQIKCQAAANIAFDLLRGGHAPQGFLLNTLATLDRDCVPAFLEQLSKRIREAGR